jgi:hypothetical protein
LNCAENGNRVFWDKWGLNPKEVKLKTLNTKSYPNMFEIFSKYSLPLRWGRARVGVDRIETI